MKENDNDNSSESGSEGSSSMETSSDEGSKNEPVTESLTNWSLSSFVKPDPKPVEKVITKPANSLNTQNVDEISIVSNMRTSRSPSNLPHDQHIFEKNGTYIPH